MGRETLSLNVSLSVSRHNSHQDDLDNAKWNDLRMRIERVLVDFPDADLFGHGQQPIHGWGDR